MMTSVSPEFRRILAVLLLLVAMLGGHALLVEPLLSWHRLLDAAWRDGGARLAHAERLAATLPALRAALEGLSAAAEGPAAYVTAESETLAVAELQDVLTGILLGNGAELIGTRVLDTVDEGDFQRIGLRVTMSATLVPLQATLYQLEAHLPILIINDLSIQRRDAGQGPTQGDADPLLDIAFDLLAYRKVPA
jgi:hypothetical protein